MNTTTSTGTVEHIDPQTIVIEANVRPSAPVTAEFVQSIRENGVLVPAVGRRDEHGNVLVRMGQRRTLGAREAGVATIPVYIVEGDDTTAERIIRQLIENDQRDDLSASDRAAAYQQLAFEGMPVTTIAKRLGAKRNEVKTALTVAENATAAAVVAQYPITLDQAATLIEFEDDPEATASLIRTATTEPAQFAHAVQRARDERARARTKAEAVADLTARGYEVLSSQPDYYDKGYTNIRDLRTADGERVTAEHVEHVDGRAAYVTVYFGQDIASVTYYVTNPAAAGFRKEGGSAAGPMTDEQKAERRELIANNKAWASAETVRREWLTTFLARKALPKDAAAFVALRLATFHNVVGSAVQQNNALAHSLLGLEETHQWGADHLGDLIERTPAKAGHVALAVVLGGIESSTSKNTWRYPDAHKAAYFRKLAAWGYGLSDVEQLVIDSIDATNTTPTIYQTDQTDQNDEPDLTDQAPTQN
jgi:ParB family chromosome partitioning protein